MLSVLTMAFLGVMHARPAAGADWLTKGGSPNRESYVAQSIGRVTPGIESTVDFMGESATQPITVNGVIYHVAGNSLWRYDPKTGKPPTAVLFRDVTKDMRKKSVGYDNIHITTSSTPTYSSESGMLYFGTADGRIWAFDTVDGRRVEEKRLLDYRLSECPIVTSPLVIRKDGRDLVIVADKNDKCAGSTGGIAYLVWGLDQVGEVPDHVTYDELRGSWMTPSPVPVPAREGDGPAVLIGADGTKAPCFGEVHQLQILGGPNPPYEFKKGWTYCQDELASGGFAGSFARSGDHVYWIDTEGRLFARQAKTGEVPDGWDKITPLAKDGARAFTNTEPAIDPDTHTLYITLRNYTQPGDPFPLRGCPSLNCPEPGAPGAVIALDVTPGQAPTRKWLYRMDHAEPEPLYYEAINTAPLILKAQNALLFGDVNGTLRSLSLDTGEPQAFMSDADCLPVDTFSVLPDGTRPGRGDKTYSQRSGIGTDPMLADIPGANPLLALGANWADKSDPARKGSRFVLLKAGEPYNLRWDGDLATDPPSPWQPDTSVTVTGQVRLENTDRALVDLLRGRSIKILWWLAGTGGFPNAPAQVRYLGETPLDGDLLPGVSRPVAFPFNSQAGDPAEGILVGLIDPDTVVFAGSQSGEFANFLLRVIGLAPRCTPDLREISEIVALTTPEGPRELLIRNFQDNYGFSLYKQEALADVSITLEAPDAVDWTPGGAYPVTIYVTNRSGKALDVPVSASVATGLSGSWSLGTRTVTVGPGETAASTRTVSIIRCSDAAVVRATANPAPRTFAEVSYDDNNAAAATSVGPCGESGVPGNFAAGPGRTIMVMPDCEPETDPASPRVCKNYDLTWD